MYYFFMNGLNRYEGEGRAPLPAPVHRWRLLVFGPLLFLCIGCLGLTLVLSGWFNQRRARSSIPMTGSDPRLPQETLLPKGHPSIAPDEAVPAPGQVYRYEVDRVLSICYASFHQFYLFEELMLSEPSVVESESWRQDAQDVIDTFREDCEGLGTLPDAPRFYAQVDHWLKMAAGEVAPAAENLSRALEAQPGETNQADDLQRAVTHMMNFVEYTHNAEAALSTMEDRREVHHRGAETLTRVP